MVLLWILLSTLLVTLLSLIGILTLSLNKNFLEKIVFSLAGFSAGALIGGAFLHLIPEALEKSDSQSVFSFVILGIVLFFVMERYFYWRHCHNGVCSVHAFSYLNLIGDGIHNFIDGAVIAASFIVSIKLGIVTTMAVALHELPQELGDFGVLVYGGFTPRKALFYNFISALTAMLGAILSFFLSGLTQGFSAFLLPFTAGGFIYIAASDLIPQIHKENDTRRSIGAFMAFLFGIILMGLSRIFLKV